MPTSTNDPQYLIFGPKGTIYPGHCVTLAYLILQAYPSLEAATSREKDASCPSALSNSRIPGAGGCVYSALDVLKHAFEHGIESAFAFGDTVWQRETETAYRDRREPGQAQADGIKSHFRELFQTWPKQAISST